MTLLSGVFLPPLTPFPSYSHSAPCRELPCQQEEAAVVSCSTDAACASAVSAYELCAEREISSLMNPNFAR
jgi:hypothetical protein